MSDLIRKLESAAEGSRELDIAAHKAIGWELAPPEADCAWWNDNGDTFYGVCPHYTTSIDAALTLVPEGWDWQLEWEDGAESVFFESKGIARVEMGNPDLRICPEAATPALALCAAALRAREVMGASAVSSQETRQRESAR